MADRAQEIREILYKPRTGQEVVDACLVPVRIYLYSDLVDKMKRAGDATAVLYDMCRQCKNNLILVQDPKKMNSGHWTALTFHPENRSIYFFSSYGGRPDEEKNMWIPKADLLRSGQDANIFNDGLRDMMRKQKWVIHYSQYPYQRVGDNTATCGIWCAAFMSTKLNPDEFHDFIIRKGHTPVSLYKTFFQSRFFR